MLRKTLVATLTLAFVISNAMAADTAKARKNLSAAEIASKNVAVRGGLQAWRAVQALSMSGMMGAGGDQRIPVPAIPKGKGATQMPTNPRLKEEAQLPFRMEMQRPRKVRFELQFAGKTAVQVYDGGAGWKLRPYLNRLDVEPYTAEELKLASIQTELDGPLVDYAAKGTQIELAGMEKIEDRDTYRLKLTFKDGRTQNLWIDADTFLETKVEGQPRRLDGKMHPVEVYYRNYKPVSGLQIPFVLETRVLPIENANRGAKQAPVQVEKVTIEKVEVNPRLDASRFTKPTTEMALLRH